MFEGRQPNSAGRKYREVRYIYPYLPVNDHWEKVLQVGEDRFAARGLLFQKMSAVEVVHSDKDNKVTYSVETSFRMPNPLSLTVMANSSFMIKNDEEDKFFQWAKYVLQDFSHQETENGFVGLWVSKAYNVLIKFDAELNYMPTEVRGYYASKGEVEPGAKPESLMQNHAYTVKTKWRKAEGKTVVYLPSTVTNTVHRINRSSKNSREMTLQMHWKVGAVDVKALTIEKLNIDPERNELKNLKVDMRAGFAKSTDRK